MPVPGRDQHGRMEKPSYVSRPQRRDGEPIAIVGMAGRFPGATPIEDLRRNLLEGVESISFFSEDELDEAGVPHADRAQPGFVGAAPVVGNTDLFDAAL